MTSLATEKLKCQPNSDQPCCWLLLSLAIGILIDRFADLEPWGYLGLAFSSLALWLILFLRRQYQYAACVLLIGTMSIGSIWHHVYWNYFPENEIGLWASEGNKPVALMGEVTTESRFYSKAKDVPLSFNAENEKTFVEFQASAIRIGKNWVPCCGKVGMTIQERVYLQVGQRFRVFGMLEPTESTRNPSEFDANLFYRSRRMFARLYCDGASSIEAVEATGLGSVQIRSILRQRLNASIWRNIDERRAGLAVAILLGNREQLSNQRQDEFMLTGTVHVLAISGLHIGILAGVLFGVLRLVNVPRILRLWIVILFVVLYTWLVEFRAPVTRSMILIVVICFSRILGRPGFSLNALALSGIIVLIVNPTDLFGVGPQLSFLAVFAMSTVLASEKKSDPVKRLVATTRTWPVQWWNGLVAQVAKTTRMSGMIWLVTVPLVAYYFHLFVPIGLLVNPIVLMPMSTALFGGLVVLVFGGWMNPIAIVGGVISDVSLNAIQFVVGASSRISLGHGWTSGPQLWSIWLFYFVFVACGIYSRKFWSIRRLMCFVLIWLGCCWLGPNAIEKHFHRLPKSAMQLTVVDVGHGTCVLAELPGGERLLIDAGSFGSAESGARSIASVLWSERHEHIDALFISHSDVDHFNAVPDLCERFSIGRVYVSPNVLNATDDSVEYLRDVLRKANINCVSLTAGMELKLKHNAKLRVLGPRFYMPPGTDNSHSLVLELIGCGRRVLLPADIEPPGLELLLSQKIDKADVALAPHHGSLGSHPIEFVNWCRPNLIVLSGMKSRIDARSLKAYGAHGSQVISTGDKGAIRIQLTPDGIYWQSWIDDNRHENRRSFGRNWKRVSAEFSTEN